MLANPEARFALLTGLLIRIPLWAGMVIMTLHVVTTLERSYAAAGLVTTAATVAAAFSGPWRGRLLDRRGLRRTVLPSLIVLTACWSVAPFMPYWILVGLVFVAGLFVVPSFSIVRQVLIAAVPDDLRKTALVLDSVAVELSFMIGPALGVIAATTWPTPWVLMGAELLTVVGGLALWIINPSMRRENEPIVRSAKPASQDAEPRVGEAPLAVAKGSEPAGHAPPPARRVRVPASLAWVSPAVIAILAASVACTIVLTGTDLATIAALREWGQASSVGWLLAIWGAGSAIGGLVYGALRHSVSAFWLLGLLALATAPLALVQDRLTMAIALFVGGLFVAPTVTATTDHLTRVVPERVRGEALGWHGSALTTGSAMGAPLIGVAIDLAGWRWGFGVAALIGVLLTILGLIGIRLRRRRRAQQLARP